MGTFGKILLFINLLAAGGVAYLATQDWAKRQDVQANALHYYLVRDGFPIEAPADGQRSAGSVPLVVDMSGLYRTSDVTQKFLDTHFNGTDGGPLFGGRTPQPASQVEELTAVRAKANAQLAGGDVEQLGILCGKFGPPAGQDSGQSFTPGWLIGLAENFEERDLVRRLAEYPATNPAAVADAAKTARDILNKKFESALAAPNARLADEETAGLKAASDALRKSATDAQKAYADYVRLTQQQPPPAADDPALLAAATATQSKLKAETDAFDGLRKALTDLGTAAARDAGDRQRRIAHLLVHLDPSAAWQKRVALVVGVKNYLQALSDHATRLRDMAVTAEQQVVSGQTAFSEEYELLKSLAVERSILLDRQRKVTVALQEQDAASRASARQRREQLKAHQAELARVQADVVAALARQAAAEQAVFADQQAVGDALSRTAALWKDLDAAERRKAGLPPP